MDLVNLEPKGQNSGGGDGCTPLQGESKRMAPLVLDLVTTVWL